ncbi:MAG: K(+)-transporting ATPase subunit C [FCB group bacterium]|nr:K(+)-transporting ATPase subunit C [FCB group bacterium]
MLKEIRTALAATLALAVLLCGLYPAAVWATAQVAFPGKANGSLIERDGKIVGSRLIGQPFAAPHYFHPRPSAAGSGYDAAASSGSNLGPTSKKLLDAVAQRTVEYRRKNGLPSDARVPADAVTASGSGLDPHISPRNAELQAQRVATARGLKLDDVRALTTQHTQGRDLFVFGEPRVNVVTLNLALDERH